MSVASKPMTDDSHFIHPLEYDKDFRLGDFGRGSASGIISARKKK